MKTPHLATIAFFLVIVFSPFNTILAQNESTPTIQFDYANYFTEKMSCNFYITGKVLPQDQTPKKATIIVTDPSANKYSTSIDRITVTVWSDSDKKGIEITAYETRVNSGIFKGTVTISEGQSTQDIIHVSDGDTLWANYAGTTPWSTDTTKHGVTTTAFIGATCPPLERVPASGIQITDNKGNEEKSVLADKQLQIRSNLTNVTIRNQTFAYIVQIQDKDGTIESLSWLSGVLLPSQTLGPSVSWTPVKIGNYTVQIFVWQSINNPNSLSPPVSKDLTVLPSLSSYTRSTIKNAENFQCQTGYELMIKSNNNSTACVTPQTAQKLVDRGWAGPINENEYENKYRFDVYPAIDYQNNLLGIQNRTYDFMILNDTMTSYHNPPLQMTFHGIVFTLLPSPWYGGPPGSCGGYELRADAKFDDGSHEQIGTFVQGQPCSDNYTQTNLSIHTNPQVGVSVLYQSVRLLVSSATQTAVQFLHLSLSTNSSHIQYGHALGIDISLNNTSSDTVMIGAASNPPRDDLNTGPCDNLPFGIAILQGFYTQDNMTDAASIPLFPTPPCPFVPSPKSFTFQPLSSQASMECAGMFSCTDSVTMERQLSISGSLQYNVQGPFGPGIYTIVGGDEWGHTVIQHFMVTNSSSY